MQTSKPGVVWFLCCLELYIFTDGSTSRGHCKISGGCLTTYDRFLFGDDKAFQISCVLYMFVLFDVFEQSDFRILVSAYALYVYDASVHNIAFPLSFGWYS